LQGQFAHVLWRWKIWKIERCRRVQSKSAIEECNRRVS
jgi:hypothetical protein